MDICFKNCMLYFFKHWIKRYKNDHWVIPTDISYIITCMLQFHYLHCSHKVVQGQSTGVGASGHKIEEKKETSVLPWLHSSSYMFKHSWSLVSLILIVSISALWLYPSTNHFYWQWFCYFSHQRRTVWIINNFIWGSWEQNYGILFCWNIDLKILKNYYRILNNYKNRISASYSSSSVIDSYIQKMHTSYFNVFNEN